MTHSEWLTVARPRAAAPLRVICFPHAGAGGTVYRTWAAALPDWIEVAAVLLPGREARLDEPAEPDLDVLLHQLLAGIAADLTERPFVLLGHSMGGLVAFELARALEAGGGPIPRALVVTGCRAPHALRPPLNIGGMNSEEFLALLASYGGTPPHVLANPELLELFLPTLRADITMVEDYRVKPGPPLPIPIIAYGGKDDDEVTAAEMAAWSQYTSAGFRSRTFGGGHFFLHDRPEAVSRLACDLVAMGALPVPPRCPVGY